MRFSRNKRQKPPRNEDDSDNSGLKMSGSGAARSGEGGVMSFFEEPADPVPDVMTLSRFEDFGGDAAGDDDGGDGDDACPSEDHTASRSVSEFITATADTRSAPEDSKGVPPQVFEEKRFQRTPPTAPPMPDIVSSRSSTAATTDDAVSAPPAAEPTHQTHPHLTPSQPSSSSSRPVSAASAASGGVISPLLSPAGTQQLLAAPTAKWPMPGFQSSAPSEGGGARLSPRSSRHASPATSMTSVPRTLSSHEVFRQEQHSHLGPLKAGPHEKETTNRVPSAAPDVSQQQRAASKGSSSSSSHLLPSMGSSLSSAPDRFPLLSMLRSTNRAMEAQHDKRSSERPSEEASDDNRLGLREGHLSVQNAPHFASHRRSTGRRSAMSNNSSVATSCDGSPQDADLVPIRVTSSLGPFGDASARPGFARGSARTPAETTAAPPIVFGFATVESDNDTDSNEDHPQTKSNDGQRGRHHDGGVIRRRERSVDGIPSASTSASRFPATVNPLLLQAVLHSGDGPPPEDSPSLFSSSRAKDAKAEPEYVKKKRRSSAAFFSSSSGILSSNEGDQKASDEAALSGDSHSPPKSPSKAQHVEDRGSFFEEQAGGTTSPAERKKRRRQSWRGPEQAASAEIQWDFALETLEYKAEALRLGGDLRVYFLFVISFCIFFLLGRDITRNYYFSRAVQAALVNSEAANIKQNKVFRGITSASEYNAWTHSVFVNQMYSSQRPYGYSIPLGAWRMRVHRVRSHSCDINNAIVPVSLPSEAQQCLATWSDKAADTGSPPTAFSKTPLWSYQSCDSVAGGSYISGLVARYNCGGFSFIVPFFEPIPNGTDTEHVKKQLPFPNERFAMLSEAAIVANYTTPRLFNDPPFIDNAYTRIVITELFLYSPVLQTFLGVKMFAEVTAGGMWIPDFQYRVFRIFTSSDVPKALFDIFFYVFVLYYVVQLVADGVRFYIREQKILAFFLSMWNILEIVNLCVFLSTGMTQIIYVQECRKHSFDIANLAFSQKYPDNLDQIMFLYQLQIYLNSINTVLTFIKLLKFFRLNDRLNVLTRTLAESQDSIIGVLVIFFLIVSAYAMTGHGLFGMGLWRFRSIDSSFSTLLLMLVGVFDYDEIKNENRVQASVYFWSYMILALFCMLNFLIGVLMEAFAEVSATHALLPLDTVLLKTFADWKRLLHPKNIWMGLVSQIRGDSRPSLLFDAAEQLRQYRLDVKYPVDSEVAIEHQVLSLADFSTALGPELCERIGHSYLAYVWDDLVYEFDVSKESSETKEAAKHAEMAARGISNVLQGHMQKLNGFTARFIHLQEETDALLQSLERVQA